MIRGGKHGLSRNRKINSTKNKNIQLQNNNNKNEIGILNEFNNSISKSVAQNNLYDSLDEIKKRNKKQNS